MSYKQILLDTLRQRGYRVTPQREMIITAVAQNKHHMTAEEIFARVQHHTKAINIATIYRTLDFLVKEGLAIRTSLDSGQIVYTNEQHGTHIHLICRRCGKIIEANYRLMDSLRDQIQQQYGFGADLQHLSLSGLCAECQQTFPEEPAT